MASKTQDHLLLACQRLEEQGRTLRKQEKEFERVSNRLDAAEKTIERLLNRSNLEKADESFKWEILNLKSRLAHERSISSEPFFLRGYRIILFLCLKFPADISFMQRSMLEDPDDQQVQVCIGFRITRGKYDGELEWPFRKSLNINVFVQFGPSWRKDINLKPDKAILRPVDPNEDEIVAVQSLEKFSCIEGDAAEYCVTVAFAN